MKYITLYKRDFKLNPDDGDSFFDDICRNLNLDPNEVDDYIELKIEEVIDYE